MLNGTLNRTKVREVEKYGFTHILMWFAALNRH